MEAIIDKKNQIEVTLRFYSNRINIIQKICQQDLEIS